MVKNNQNQASKKVRAEIENAVDASEIKSPLSKIWKKLTVSERKQIALKFFDIADQALACAIHEAFKESAQIEREACAQIADKEQKECEHYEAQQNGSEEAWNLAAATSRLIARRIRERND